MRVNMEEIRLMKGNEVIAEAAVRCGCDGYFGYPITPQSEILETLTEMRPWETTGMIVLQAESETAAINMVYGGAACGKRVMTSSSSPGISLMCEGLSYLAGAELPCLLVNVSRGGPGLGTIQPSQADYFQAVKGGGHGDYHLIVLAPYSVQEMYDFVPLGFELAFKYCNPVMILADGVIGQMMEKVVLTPQQPRWTDEYIAEKYDWALTGKPSGRVRNVVTSNSIRRNRNGSMKNSSANMPMCGAMKCVLKRSGVKMRTTSWWLMAHLPVFARKWSKWAVRRELKWACCVRLRSFPSLPRQSANCPAR